jgi:two-component system, NarL family, nitrate/nitrite response regulator NarL
LPSLHHFRYTKLSKQHSPFINLPWALGVYMTEVRPQFNAGESTIRVLVADHSRIHTRLLADALNRDPLLKAIPFEGDSSGLISSAITSETEVLVLSSNLDEFPSRGLALLQQIRSKALPIRSVLLLESSGEESILSALRAGAKGIFSKNDPLERLGECVRSVYLGKVWANEQALAVAFDALSRSPGLANVNAGGMKLLSKRELQVVQSIAEGLTNREIAEQLKLSQHTVKNYLFRIFDKLGVSSRIELLSLVMRYPDFDHDGRRGEETTRSRSNAQAESEVLQKSAEAGLPAAQLALAHMHLLRRRDPQDLVLAYMWYLIATERALTARGFVTKLLTTEQIEEAKHRATAWLSKFNRTSASKGPTAVLAGPADGEAAAAAGHRI